MSQHSSITSSSSKGRSPYKECPEERSSITKKRLASSSASSPPVKCRKIKNNENIVETSISLHKFERGLWLVRVPPDVSSLWLSMSDIKEVATVTLTGLGSKVEAEVTLNLNKSMTSLEEKYSAFGSENVRVYDKYKLTPTALLSESGVAAPIFAVAECNDTEETEKQSRVYGSIKKKFKAFPIRDQEYTEYLRRKKNFVRQSRLPIQLEKPVLNSMDNSKNDIEKKKRENKKYRGDTEEVAQRLFGVFETKRYYTFKELINITEQPASFLKEVLKEYCNYSTKGIHRAQWELKPEYRHYENENQI